MSESRVPASTPRTSGLAVFTKTSRSAFSMISTNGPRSLATVSTRLKKC